MTEEAFLRKCLDWAKKRADFDLSVFRRVVRRFFKRGKIPAITKVLLRFEEDDTQPTVDTVTLQRMLKLLGF